MVCIFICRSINMVHARNQWYMSKKHGITSAHVQKHEITIIHVQKQWCKVLGIGIAWYCMVNV